MDLRLIHLKIKVKNLADEADLIRFEANKLKGSDKHNLNEHRKGSLRQHARENQLAYGLLRGVPYDKIEKKSSNPPNFAKVIELAKRFNRFKEPLSNQQIEAWVEWAKEYLKGNHE